MDRLAKLRHRSSVGLNSSSTSSLTGTGYETANDESITSGCSMYYSMTEGEEAPSPRTGAEARDDCKEDQTLSCSHATVEVTDQTLQNDFSVEEVSTIRKVTIALKASPATVEIASQMSVKYMGVSSTPAKGPPSARKVKPKTPAGNGNDLSGFAELNGTGDKKSLSIMRKMREPKLSECSSTEEGDDSRFALDSSVRSAVEIEKIAAVGNKSYGTNVLSNFFASLDVNKCSPRIPEIKVDEPVEDKTDKTDKTPPKRRDSNSLQNFFESLKKDPMPDRGKENKPASAVERRKSVRKSLMPKASEERAKTRSSLLAVASPNRAASSIVKSAKKANPVKLIPEKLKQMRRAAQLDLVSVKRKSVVPAPMVRAAVVANPKADEKEPTVDKSKNEETVDNKKDNDVVGDCLKVGASEAGGIAVKKASPKIPKLRKSIMPTAVRSRRSVVPAAITAQSKVSLRIPAKTTLASSESARRNSLGKRPSVQTKTERTEQPLAKLRKSLAPVKEATASKQPPKKEVTKPLASRIRPPTATGASVFKKPDSFTCDICQRSFRLKLTLEGHKKSTHPHGTGSPSSRTAGSDGGATTSKSTDANKCRHCAKSFASAKILSNHLASNCVKIPLLEKRKLLAQNEQQRAASAKTTTTLPTNDRSTRERMVRPSTSRADSSNRENSSNNSDTSTSSSIGDTSTNTSGGKLTNNNNNSTSRKLAVGHTGITRTPKKEMKCHLCVQRFLNAVEYALHVQTHVKGISAQESPEATTLAPERDENGLLRMDDAKQILQKLAFVRKRSARK
ncbi:serine-rich adhesin for platelets [Toxorhynchites rutilus septentrionalis]|uniref:serine-rich adhesin for platelets n=1 Tax=Toxorhynchites rutilus septentrionalis TaxID=329112 RepID=UPI00247A880A|nr:serine-rich adhesin for platelets [Toxorhynchites rutilus septentrionalis]